MADTYKDALSKILAATSVAKLREIIQNTSVKVEGAADNVTSLLYSGEVYGTSMVNNTLLNEGAERLVTIDKTPLGTLLVKPAFKARLTALLTAELTNSVPGFLDLSLEQRTRLIDTEFRKVYNNTDIDNRRLPYDSTTLSLWDEGSRRFVLEATGNIRVIAGRVTETSIMMETELHALWEKTGSASVDGVDLSHIKSLPYEDARNAVLTNAFVQTHLSLDDLSPQSLEKFSRMTPERLGIALGDMQNRANITTVFDYLPSELRSRMEAGQKAMAQAGTALANDGVVKGLNKFGLLAGVLAFALATNAAAAEHERGNTEGAKTIMLRWFADAAGSEIGGIAGGAIGAIAVAVAAAYGFTMLIPAAVMVIFGGMLVGAFAGSEIAMSQLHRLEDAMEHVVNAVKRLFDDSRAVASPLILDLDGDGIETLSITGSAIHFDHNTNGFAEKTGWVGKDDGLLVWDRNGNGAIDDGSELFGNFTASSQGASAANGFMALSALDANGDGIVNEADPRFADLRIWRDDNSDGTAQAAELLSLATAGVAGLRTDYRESNGVDANGNLIRQLGNFVRSGGGAGDMNDIWFVTDPARTLDRHEVEVSPLVAGLPELHGFGNVRNLRQAMTLDASGALAALVQKFALTTSMPARKALIDEIIFRWAGVVGIDPLSRTNAETGNSIGDARKLVALERFMGQDFVGSWLDGNPRPQAAALLLRAFAVLSDHVYDQLMVQTHLRPYLASIAIGIDETGLHFDVTALLAQLQLKASSDLPAAITDFLDLRESAGPSLVAMGWEPYQTLQALLGSASITPAVQAVLTARKLVFVAPGATSLTVTDTDGSTALGSTGNDSLTGGAGADRLYGLGGNDTLFGSGAGDILDGGDGDDLLALTGSGTAADATLIGGRGNDTLTGGSKSTTYLFNIGDGKDTINHNNPAGDIDILRFGPGISPANVTPLRSGLDMVFEFAGGSERVMVKNWFSDAARSRQIEQIQFADGTLWTGEALTGRVLEMFGTGAADNLAASVLAFAEVLHGGAGNDTLAAYGSGDTLDAGDGDDVLTVIGTPEQARNITFAGGKGNDTITGGNGSNTYVFNRGDGQDSIKNYNVLLGVDVLRFGPGIVAADVTVRRSGVDLVFSLAGGTDRVTALNWFVDATLRTQIERVEFADGTFWGHLQLSAQVLEVFGTEQADSLSGIAAFTDILHGGAGNDNLQANGAGDILDGGDGNDTLSVTGSGLTPSLTFIGGKGNDLITGGNQSNTYVFNAGDGQDTISNYNIYSGIDILRFGAGIAAGDLQVRRSGTDLILALGDGADQITCKGWFLDATRYRQIERIEFADATVLTPNDLNPRALEIWGTAAAETLTGIAAFADVLHGLGGNDTLQAAGNADTLDGGDGDDTYIVGSSTGLTLTETAAGGNDTVQAAVSFTLGDNFENLQLAGALAISGTGNALDNRLSGNSAANLLDAGAGNDFLDGKAGNDTLVGGSGNDSYIMGRGYGSDTVLEDDGTVGNLDTVRFDTGIAINQLWFRKIGNNLEASIIGTSDKLVISNWYLGDACHVESFVTSSGATLLDSQVQNLVQAMASFSPPAAGQTQLPASHASALAPVLAANWH